MKEAFEKVKEVRDIYTTTKKRGMEIGGAVVIGRSQDNPDLFAFIAFNFKEDSDCMTIVRRQDMVEIRDAITAELEKDGSLN